VTLTRTDGNEETIVINVQKGFCPHKECTGEMIQNLDVNSCDCEPLHAHEEHLIDTRENAQVSFLFDMGAKLTLREWAMTTGEYEWTLPSVDTIKCFTMIGEAFDDGRYRQVSFEAVQPDCRDVLIRFGKVD